MFEIAREQLVAAGFTADEISEYEQHMAELNQRLATFAGILPNGVFEQGRDAFWALFKDEDPPGYIADALIAIDDPIWEIYEIFMRVAFRNLHGILVPKLLIHQSWLESFISEDGESFVLNANMRAASDAYRRLLGYTPE